MFVSDPRPICLYAGRVAVEKNLEAFLSLDLPGTKYVIGEGPALRMLRERYPKARFPGFKYGEELASYVAAADVFVFPSRTDTFGLVLLEAMACAVPVVAYPVTGPIDVVKNGITGILDDDLGSAIQRALALDGSKARAYALAHSWSATTAIFASHLSDNRPHNAESFPLAGAAGRVTDPQGQYLGIGTLFALLRRITELQVRNARYANPLPAMCRSANVSSAC